MPVNFTYFGGGVIPFDGNDDTDWRTLPCHAFLTSGGDNGYIVEYEDEGPYQVRSGEAVLIRRNRRHRVVTVAGESTSTVWAHFSVGIQAGVDLFELLEFPAVFPEAESTDIIRLCRELSGIPVDSLSNLLKAKARGFAFAAALTAAGRACADAAERLGQMQRLAPALELIHRRLSDPPTISELARAVGLSESHFCSVFREAMQQPPLVYCRRFRLTLAMNRLASSDASVESIAAEFGFYDAFHFSKLFKRFFKETPATFRRRNAISPPFWN